MPIVEISDGYLVCEGELTDIEKELSKNFYELRELKNIFKYIEKDYKRLSDFWHKDPYLDEIVRKWEGDLIFNIAINLIKDLKNKIMEKK